MNHSPWFVLEVKKKFSKRFCAVGNQIFIGALPPPAYNPVPENEPSVIPTTENTSSLQGSSLTGEISGTKTLTSEPDQRLGTDGVTQADDKMDYDAISDPQSLFQGRRRWLELRRRLSDQCFSWLISASDYVGAQDQSQAAGTPPATNSAPPPQLDGLLPNAIALFQKDSSSFATVQVTQLAKNADGIYPPRHLHLQQRRNHDQQRAKPKSAPRNRKSKFRFLGTANSHPIAPFSRLQKTIPVLFPRGQEPQDPLEFRYDDEALGSLGPDFGLTFDSNDEKRTHNCVVGAWIDSKRDI